MTQYLRNLWLWARGFARLADIDFKPGWGPEAGWLGVLKWWALYLVDYGPNVWTGGAVESISRMAHRHRDGWVWQQLTGFLNWIDPGHGAESGPALWGSVECSVGIRLAVTAGWLGLIFWVV